MSSDEHEVTRHVYAAVLSSDTVSPVSSESDEKKAHSDKAAEDKLDSAASNPHKTAKTPDVHEKPILTRVDLDGIAMRIVPLPLPARNYQDLRTGKPGLVYVLEAGAPEEQTQGRILQKFDIKARKTEKVADNIASFDLSEDGKRCSSRPRRRPPL